MEGVPLRRLASASSPRWGANRELERAIGELDPQVVIWHLGLTSLLHQSLAPAEGRLSVGIFTSPLYRFGELARLGLLRLARGYRLSSLHLVGSLLPARLLRRRDFESRLRTLVVQTHTTRRRLLDRRLWRGKLQVIPPGVDPAWLTWGGDRQASRRRLGYSDSDLVVVYFGPPEPLRGLPTLLRAFALAYPREPRLKLLVLSRPRDGHPAGLERPLRDLGIQQVTRLVDGSLDPEQLARHVAAGDLVALPFELVPSDAPLSPLEAQALGQPLVTTRVACLPELAPGEGCYLAEPSDPVSLAQAILRCAAAGRGGSKQGMNNSHPHKTIRNWSAVGEEWTHLFQSL
jgi:glycosyltransferase involved in cell wall biosynthesis